jgi:hypothetical protein
MSCENEHQSNGCAQFHKKISSPRVKGFRTGVTYSPRAGCGPESCRRVINLAAPIDKRSDARIAHANHRPIIFDGPNYGISSMLAHYASPQVAIVKDVD